MAGTLRSTDITPLPRYSNPARHPLVFGQLPGVAGYTAYLPPAISRPGQEKLFQLLSLSLSPCRRFHPAEVNSHIGSVRLLVLSSPFGGRLGPRGYFFRGHNAFSFDTAQ